MIAFGENERVHSFESLKGTLKVEEIHQIVKFAKCWSYFYSRVIYCSFHSNFI